MHLQRRKSLSLGHGIIADGAGWTMALGHPVRIYSIFLAEFQLIGLNRRQYSTAGAYPGSQHKCFSSPAKE